LSSITIYEKSDTKITDDLVVTHLQPGHSLSEPTRLFVPDEPPEPPSKNRGHEAEYVPRRFRRRRNSRFSGIPYLMQQRHGVRIS
jgi:hypothetical protein